MALRTPRTTLAFVFVLSGCLTLLLGCSGSDGPENVVGPGSEEALNAELRDLLMAASDGEGLSYFRLPEANELDRIPQDPKNPLTRAKVQLGQVLYHETALSVDNIRPEGRETYSCAACHHVQAGFAANLPQGISEGGTGFGFAGEGRSLLPEYRDGDADVQPIRTPTTLNSAYQELMLWNGQFGGVGDNLGTEHLWSEGTPLESNSLGMHGLETQVHAGMLVHRMLTIDDSSVISNSHYRTLFRMAFPGDPDPFSRLNCALAVAAYERTLLANQAPFQRWLDGNAKAMTNQEIRGAILFFGKAECVDCHSGPALNSMTFHALGMDDLDGSWDAGRVNLAATDGTVPMAVRKGRGGFTQDPADDFKFKTPQLYNLIDSPFYGHGSSFATLREVVEYKNDAAAENAIAPLGQLAEGFHPLGLTPEEVTDLVAFLEHALYDAKLERYVPEWLPSGNCFPVNDPQAQADLGCVPGKAAPAE